MSSLQLIQLRFFTILLFLKINFARFIIFFKIECTCGWAENGLFLENGLGKVPKIPCGVIKR